VSGVPAETIAPQTLRLVARPNPFQTGATIAFTLPAAGHVDLAVYDLGGRLVRSLHQGRVEAGAGSVAWDGRDDSGRETAGGIYFIRLRAHGMQVQTRIVKLH
jgi:flagellar hook assembly protein FlgD